MSCRAISMADPTPSSTAWLIDFLGKSKGCWIQVVRKPQLEEICLTLQAVNHQKSESHQGNHSNPHFGNATAWLHATLMLPFRVWRLRQKPLLLFEHDYNLQTAISGAIPGSQMHWSKSVKSCCERSRSPRFRPWIHRNSRISCRTSITSLYLGNVMSLTGYLCQKLTMQTLHSQRFRSLPDWYLAAESETTTSICSREWCTGVVLAVTPKPICLKSSTQAATGQLLFQPIWALKQLWTAFSFSLAQTATPSCT